MVNTGTVTLKCASVNSGTAVNLNCRRVRYTYKNNIRADPLASSYTLSECEHRGFENPRIMLTGVISDDAGTNEITEILLKEFAKIKNEQLTLQIMWGSTGKERTFTNFEGSSISGSETGIPVIVDSIDFDIDPSQAHNAHILPFVLNLIEDKI